VPAGTNLRKELGLDLLGLAHRGLGLAGDLLADVALVAGERVTAGVDLDLEAGSSLADHGPSVLLRHAVWHQKNDDGASKAISPGR